jgi:GTPase SAR1 family protein
MLPVPIGKTDDIYDQGRTFTILPEARRKHMAIFGKSGVGKTTLLRKLIAWDIHQRLGTSVLDPHGSLIDDVLEIIPRSRINDVIYFNPKERSRVLGINILEPVSEDYQPLMVSYLISIFKALWHDSWGRRMEDIPRNSAFALLENAGTSEPLTGF